MAHANGQNSEPAISAEVEVLLLCARTHVNADQAARVRRRLREPLDWKRLLTLAHRHKLEPLLYRQLKSISADAVPPNHLEHLRQRFHQNGARNLFLMTELRDILKLFKEHGIEVIPYKGPVLALAAYGNPALRVFSDLDLLVHPRDARRAADLLISRGYAPEYNLNDERQAAYVHRKCELLFEQSESKLFVEIHWAVTPNYLSRKLEAEGFWTRLRELTLNGSPVLSFSTEDLLLILCVHAGKHLWERLAWVCDVAELIGARKDIDWERVRAEAGRAGVRRMLHLGLFLAHDLLDAPLPEKVVQEVEADPTIHTLARLVRDRLFTEEQWHARPTELFSYHFKVRENLLDAARYCYHIMIPPTPADLTSLSLPRSLSFLYYPLRPVRLIKKHGMKKLKAIGRHRNG